MSLVLLPQKMEELWDALEAHPSAALFAGGTDLLVARRAGRVRAETLVGLERLEELRGVRREGGMLRIGACATHSRCLESVEVCEGAPLLAQALRHIGGPQVRNMGTLGGNVCTASPAGDSLPPLYALEASVILRSRIGRRELPLDQFILGPGSTDLRPGEILEEIRVPVGEDYCIQHFEKVGKRNAMTISMVSLAALMRLDPGQPGGARVVREARLALGSVGPTVIRPREAEAALVGRRLDIEALRDCAALVRVAVRPIDDVRAGAGWRREVAGNLLLRLCEESVKGL